MGVNWLHRLGAGMDLPGETMPGMTVAELAGDHCVLVEGHRGVRGYSPVCVIIKVSYGELTVRGCGLELRQMSKEMLVVRGRIDSVELGRRGP